MQELEKEVSNICKRYNTRVLFNEELKYHTTFKVGGKCKAFIEINSVDVLKELLKLLSNSEEEYFIFGRGSNIIVSDKGYNGYILYFGNNFSDIKLTENTEINANCGAGLRKVGKFALENNLTGFECLNGIPGTVGGAVFMNAGAYGREVKDILKEVVSVTKDGEIKKYNQDELDLSYRKSIFQTNHEIILSAIFKLEKGDKSAIKEKMDELDRRRREKQPLEYASAGSTFKRPKGSYASLLIEQCGLKGISVGDAEVSTKHSGFIINKGNATAQDIFKLCEKVENIVFEKTGYKLEMEPIILGNI